MHTNAYKYYKDIGTASKWQRLSFEIKSLYIWILKLTNPAILRDLEAKGLMLFLLVFCISLGLNN